MTSSSPYSGYSWATFDALTQFVLQQLQPARILDIGAGEGKYGQLVRQAGLTQTRITAVEYEPLRQAQLLQAGYDEVRSISALDLMQRPDETFDVVILGDVLEHFKYSEGMDLLQYLNYRCTYLLIVTPESMPMSTPHFYEGHNSVWRPVSMQWHDYWLHGRNGMMHFYLLRGHMASSPLTLHDLMQRVNAQPFAQDDVTLTLTDEDCRQLNRVRTPLRLALHDQRIVDQPLGDDGPGYLYHFY